MPQKTPHTDPMSTPMTPAQAAQQTNRDDGGRYKSKVHAEVDLDLTADESAELDLTGMDFEGYDELEGSEHEQFCLQVSEHIPEHVQAYYVEYGDELEDNQIGDLLAGREGDARHIFDENMGESQIDGTNTAIDEALQSAGTSLTWDELDNDDYNLLQQAVWDKDTSDPFKETWKQNPDRLVRSTTGSKALHETDLPVNGSSEAWQVGSQAWYDVVTPARTQVLSERFTELGLDPQDPANAEAIEDLVENGPAYWHEGVSLDVIAYADTSELAPDPEKAKEVRIQNPTLLLTDSLNGSGFDAEVSGAVTVKISSAAELQASDDRAGSRFFLDSEGSRSGNGYSWDKIASPVPSAYRPASIEVLDQPPVKTVTPQPLSMGQRILRGGGSVDLDFESMSSEQLQRQVRAYARSEAALRRAGHEIQAPLGAFRVTEDQSVEFYDLQGNALEVSTETQRAFAAEIDSDSEVIKASTDQDGAVIVQNLLEGMTDHSDPIADAQARKARG